MKKILTILFAVVCLAACNQHENIKFDKTASEGIAGTYVGTWTRTLNEEVVSGEGTVVFTATEDAYVASIAASCENPAINRQGITNVVHSDHEYVFSNNKGDFGAMFSGRVYKDGSIDMQYKVEEQVGRFKNTYTFTFAGQKQ